VVSTHHETTVDRMHVVAFVRMQTRKTDIQNVDVYVAMLLSAQVQE